MMDEVWRQGPIIDNVNGTEVEAKFFVDQPAFAGQSRPLQVPYWQFMVRGGRPERGPFGFPDDTEEGIRRSLRAWAGARLSAADFELYVGAFVRAVNQKQDVGLLRVDRDQQTVQLPMKDGAIHSIVARGIVGNPETAAREDFGRYWKLVEWLGRGGMVG